MERPFLLDVSRPYYRKLRGRLPTGIDRVALEYVRHYADRARAVLALGSACAVLPPDDSSRVFRALLDPRADAPMGEAAGLVAKACLRGWMREDVAGCILLNTNPTNLEEAGCATRLAGRGARLVSILYDLIPMTHPEYCRPGERERHLARARGALTAGAGLISISDDTLAALREHASETGLRLPPAVVAPLASSLPKSDAGPRPTAEPCFVVVGTIEPRKNHLLLLHLWRELVESHKEQNTIPRLVIVGQRGWECENAVDLLERCPALRGTVIELGACGDRELVTYLRHAQALLFPSFAEGYGLPVAEALALGTPVIASDLRVLREVAGEIPEYVDPLDGARWRELVLDYAAAGSARRAAQLERLRAFRAPTWARHFEKVDSFLEREIGNGKQEMGKTS